MARPLEEFSADDLLLELRAREESERAADESLPDVAESDEDGPELNPELESFDTQELAQALRDTQEVIYGVDDRVDIFAVTDAALLQDADCLVALFDAADVTDNGDGTSTVATSNFGTSRNLCAGEPFRDQPIGAFCSGFLVAPDLVATAGHCVDPPNTPPSRTSASSSASGWWTPTTGAAAHSQRRDLQRRPHGRPRARHRAASTGRSCGSTGP